MTSSHFRPQTLGLSLSVFLSYPFSINAHSLPDSKFSPLTNPIFCSFQVSIHSGLDHFSPFLMAPSEPVCDTASPLTDLAFTLAFSGVYFPLSSQGATFQIFVKWMLTLSVTMPLMTLRLTGSQVLNNDDAQGPVRSVLPQSPPNLRRSSLSFLLLSPWLPCYP